MASNCAANLTNWKAGCPERWDTLKRKQTCKADPAYISNDEVACPSERPFFTSRAEKQKFVRDCPGVRWPCLFGEELAECAEYDFGHNCPGRLSTTPGAPGWTEFQGFCMPPRE